jgi:hypothetical protein
MKYLHRKVYPIKYIGLIYYYIPANHFVKYFIRGFMDFHPGLWPGDYQGDKKKYYAGNLWSR